MTIFRERALVGAKALVTLFVVSGLLSHAQAARSDTTVFGNIASDTVWTLAGSPYVIQADTHVASGVTLTIEADVQVRFDTGTRLSIGGGAVLLVNGDAGQPVLFTSNSLTPDAGDWQNVYIDQGAAATIEYCEFEFGGASSTDALTISSTAAVSVSDCDIHHNRYEGIQISGGPGVSPELFDVTVRDNGGGAIQQGGDVSPEYSNLNFTGNGEDAVFLVGDFNTPVTLDGAGLNGAHFTAKTNIDINTGGVLSLTAGTQLAFATGRDLSVNSGGDLQVNGTALNPVVFTSNSAVPVAGSWQSISVNAGGSAALNHCEIAFAGQASLDALQIGSAADVTVNDCVIRDNLDEGVRVWGGAGVNPVFTNVTVRNNGDGAVEQHGDTEPVYNNVTLSGNGNNSIYLVSDYTTQVKLDGTGLNGGHFTVLNDIEILSGGDLIVQAGTTVTFAAAAGLDVGGGGNLQLAGTPAFPVIFTSDAASPAPGDWRSIRINSSGAASFQSCGIYYAGNSGHGAISVLNADGVNINACELRHNLFSGVYVGLNSQAGISNNLVRDNGEAGIEAVSAIEFDAFNNTITNNATGVSVSDSAATLLNNIISYNGTGIDSGTDASVQAQYNDLFNNGDNYLGMDDQTGLNGNISADPLFLDPANGDFRLGFGPPVVDAGTSMGTPMLDFSGNSRFDNPAVTDSGGGDPAYYDMGALEQYCYPPAVGSEPGAAPGPNAATYLDSECVMFRDGFEG